MCFPFWKKRPKNDQNNIYIRLKCLYLPCFGGAVIVEDFKQENTSGKMSREEFMNMVEMIASECKNFSEVKYCYLFMSIFLVLLHFIFPNFLLFNTSEVEYFNAGTIIPIVLFLIAYTLFTLKISKSTQNNYMIIQKIIRTENCLKYINRGLCWRLDSNKNQLHLNLSYRNNSNHYLISEAMNSQSEIEEYAPYFDLENGEFQNLDYETQYGNHLKNAFLGLGVIGGLAVIEKYIYLSYFQ